VETTVAMKIVVTFETRPDGGLRAYSDDVPGFVLSSSDRVALIGDVKPALEKILSHMFKEPVVVEELSHLHEEVSGLHEKPFLKRERREYVTHRAA
jgi:hypothetical protein